MLEFNPQESKQLFTLPEINQKKFIGPIIGVALSAGVFYSNTNLEAYGVMVDEKQEIELSSNLYQRSDEVLFAQSIFGLKDLQIKSRELAVDMNNQTIANYREVIDWQEQKIEKNDQVINLQNVCIEKNQNNSVDLNNGFEVANTKQIKSIKSSYIDSLNNHILAQTRLINSQKRIIKQNEQIILTQQKKIETNGKTIKIQGQCD